MLFAAICNDKPGHLQVRKDNRPAHLDWLNGRNEAGAIAFAGPFLDADGNPTGSMLMVEAADEKSVRDMLAEDPYAKAGLFGSVEVRPWVWVINKPA